MPFSSNFMRVSIGKDDDGKAAILISGKTGEPKDVKALYVAVAHGKDLVAPPAGSAGAAKAPVGLNPAGGELKSTAVAAAPSAKDWSVTLPQSKPRLKAGERVIVLGVAMLKSTPVPAFWQETFTTVPVDAPH